MTILELAIDTYHYSAIRIHRVMDDGRTGARLCRCSDGKDYVIKTLGEVPPYELIAEWICGHLAIALQTGDRYAASDQTERRYL